MGNLFLCTGPDIKPNLWMWVSPNIVYPPGKLEVERPKKDPLSVLPSRDAAVKEEEASCSEGSEAQARLPSSSQPSRPCKRKTKQKHIASSPSTWEEVWTDGHRVEVSAAGCLRASKR